MVVIISKDNMKTYLGVEFIVAKIERCIDRFEGLEVDIHSLLLPIIRQDCSAIKHQPIVRYSRVEFQLLLSRGDRS